MTTVVEAPNRTAPTRVRQVVAGLAVLITAFHATLVFDLTSGIIVAIILLPVWAGVIRRSGSARALLIVGAIAWINGAWLTAFLSTDHQTSSTVLRGNSMLLIGLVAGACVVLWARSVLGSGVTGLLFGVGLLLGVRPDSNLFASNPWKFGFSVAVIVIILAIAQITRTRWLGLVALVGFAGLSTVTDARSTFAILLLSAIVVAWQLLPGRPDGTHSIGVILVTLVGVGVAVYNFGQSLILDGALGQTTQLRSLSQADAAGSLLLGGRPEIAASTSLFLHQPWGFGAGTIPTLEEVTVAKTGMAAINYQPNNGYVENYMFGGKYELHSIIGDLWAAFGIGGLAVTAFIVVIVVRGITVGMATRTAGALVAFLAVKTLWNIFFGPLLSSSTILIIVLALTMRMDGLVDPTGLAARSRVHLRAARTWTRGRLTRPIG